MQIKIASHRYWDGNNKNSCPKTVTVTAPTMYLIMKINHSNWPWPSPSWPRSCRVILAAWPTAWQRKWRTDDAPTPCCIYELLTHRFIYAQIQTQTIQLHLIILTTNLAACVSVCAVCKMWPISARALSFRLQTSRKFCSHSIIPIRCLWTAFCVPLSFIFYEKQWFRMQIVTLRRSQSPLCGR